MCVSFNHEEGNPYLVHAQCSTAAFNDESEVDESASCCMRLEKHDPEDKEEKDTPVVCTDILPQLPDGQSAYTTCETQCGDYAVSNGHILIGDNISITEPGGSTIIVPKLSCEGHATSEGVVCKRDLFFRKTNSIAFGGDYRYNDFIKSFKSTAEACINCDGEAFTTSSGSNAIYKCIGENGEVSYGVYSSDPAAQAENSACKTSELIEFLLNDCNILRCLNSGRSAAECAPSTPAPCNLSDSCDANECAGLTFDSQASATKHFGETAHCKTIGDKQCCSTDAETFNDCGLNICPGTEPSPEPTKCLLSTTIKDGQRCGCYGIEPPLFDADRYFKSLDPNNDNAKCGVVSFCCWPGNNKCPIEICD